MAMHDSVRRRRRIKKRGGDSCFQVFQDYSTRLERSPEVGAVGIGDTIRVVALEMAIVAKLSDK
jgi:hypothetical protein